MNQRKVMLSALALVMIMAITAGMVAQDSPPDPRPGATAPVREQNLDTSGLIRVHEQGVAEVDITNSSLTVEGTVDVDQVNSTVDVNVTGGTVDVGNEVDVNVTGGTLDEVTAMAPTVTRLEYDGMGVGAGEEEFFNFSTIDATWLSIASDDDEWSIFVNGPMGRVVGLYNVDGEQTIYGQSFQYPVPINQVHVYCQNESDGCQILVTVAGF